MKPTCWSCHKAISSADAKDCAHCGAPYGPMMRPTRKYGFLGNYKLLALEIILLVASLIAVYDSFEKS
jgi:hypothetical protein